MVTTMFVHAYRTVIAPVWLIVFGLLALLWSPPSVAMGAALLVVGLAGPAAMLILWRDAPLPAVGTVPLTRIEGSNQ